FQCPNVMDHDAGQRRPGVFVAHDAFDRTRRTGDMLEGGTIDVEHPFVRIIRIPGDADRRAGASSNLHMHGLDRRPLDRQGRDPLVADAGDAEAAVRAGRYRWDEWRIRPAREGDWEELVQRRLRILRVFKGLEPAIERFPGRTLDL